MTREYIEYPTGVSQEVFAIHTHNYRQITHLGIDAADDYSSPTEAIVVDDGTAFANEKLGDTIGITASTQPTGAPN